MQTTETGVYLQFFDENESVEKELPPLGPFELLIIRHNRVIGDREQVEHDMMGLGSVERWLEAELELRRALGDEPGGMRRSHMRIRAPRGDIIVRFYDYGGDDPPKVPELGPFYSLTIGKRDVRADDKLLAIRATDLSPWTLTDAVRPGVAGINKADFSVFSLSAREPRSTPAPASPALAPVVETPAAAPPPPRADAPVDGPAPWSEFVERRKVQREIYVARPEPRHDVPLTPADVNLILTVDKLKQQKLAEQLMIQRLRREQHVPPENSLHAEPVGSIAMRFQAPVKERQAAAAAASEHDEYEDESFTERLLRFIWSARLVLVSILLVLAAVSAYGYLQPRAGPNAGPPLTFAAVGDKIQTPDWTYTVVSAERTGSIAASPPSSGGYLIVHITVVKKSPEAAALDPIGFTLIDANGARGYAFPASSDVYAPATGLLWATRYPSNTIVHNHLAYDVNPGAKDLVLLIRSANVEVRLPDP
ncbi:MAG TPA: hypothetical protein VGS17_06975 [Candidatus Limnocylindria bacterium]|nr:hypothetical protein [Candidatus Limnocylindria bacterium]